MEDPACPAQTCWKKCNICKKEIPYKAKYFRCTVSTCRQKVMGLFFCSEICWDGHLGFARHRSASYEEVTAPDR